MEFNEITHNSILKEKIDNYYAWFNMWVFFYINYSVYDVCYKMISVEFTSKFGNKTFLLHEKVKGNLHEQW